MLSWGDLKTLRSDLTDAGNELLCQFGVGLGFIASIRPDGGPRLHPICPILTNTGLYALLIPSPKLRDLLRDGRYALHSYPCPENEDAFYVTGLIELIEDAGYRDSVIHAFLSQSGRQGPTPSFEDQTLVELLIDTCLVTRTNGHGDPSPRHTIWKASASPK
jgi:hypothetical protein